MRMCLAKECYLREVGYGFEIDGKKYFKRGIYVPHLTLGIFTEEHNNYSVFCSAYRYNTNDISKAELYGDLYLDFDSIDDFSKAREDAIIALSYFKICYHITEEYINIYFSGNKGLHLIIPADILGIEPMPLLNGVFKYIASAIKSFTKNKTIDTQIYDNKRLFRIPNSVHEKSHLYKIQITEEELRTLSEEEIRNLARSPRKIECKTFHGNNVFAQQQFQRMIQEYLIFNKDNNKDKKFRRRYTFTPPCVQYIIENGAIEGQRNISIACLAGFYKNCGKSLIETIDIISEWNNKNIKPTPEHELQRTVKSIFNSEKQFGCSTLKTISNCDQKHCKFLKIKGELSHANNLQIQKTQGKR